MTIGPEYLDGQELPWQDGVHRGPDVYDPNVDYDEGRWTLTGMSKEYTLYSASILVSVGLHFDPVALYWEENALSAAEAPFELVLDRPVLHGLPPPFDRTLYACPEPYANGLLTFLDRTAVTIEGAHYETVRQMLPVVDWPLVSKTSVVPVKLPTVTVAVYGLASKDVAIYWKPVRGVNDLSLVSRKLEPKPVKR